MRQTHLPCDAAVLTGDLKGSTKGSADDLGRTMALLAKAADELADWPDSQDARFTRSRGDGWQIVVLPPQRALRAALFLVARLAASGDALPTRISIGLGVATSLGTTNLSDATGSAFEHSGRALDRMRGSALLSIDGDGVGPYHRIIIRLLSERCMRWTRDQAAAMALHLHPDNPTLGDLAPQFGITPQAVNYRLIGAAATEIRASLNEWETAERRAGHGDA